MVGHEIVYASEAEAKAEAQRQQALGPDQDQIEWIYLHNHEKVWGAQRVLRHGDPQGPGPASRSRSEAVVDAVTETVGSGVIDMLLGDWWN